MTQAQINNTFYPLKVKYRNIYHGMM